MNEEEWFFQVQHFPIIPAEIASGHKESAKKERYIGVVYDASKSRGKTDRAREVPL